MPSQITSAQLGGVANLCLMVEIKPGFVDAFETFSYARRLGALLKALNAARQLARESAMAPNPFPDAVARLGIIRAFRYNIVPPDPALRGAPDAFAPLSATGRQWLLLNVVFDGGWEPYMRVIYRDIGALLDAILCNCVGYPGSLHCDFDTYSRWVRAHEVPHGLFYAESALSADDQRYLAQVAQIQVEEADPAAADRRIAGHAMAPVQAVADAALEAARRQPDAAIQLGLKSLKGLHALARLYPARPANEHLILIRFAQLVLREFHRLAGELKLAENKAFAPFWPALAWFATPCQAAFDGVRAPPLVFARAAVQGGILEGYPGITQGALVLLRVVQADAAVRFLEALAPAVTTAAADAGPGALRRNVALTLSGLRALGVSDARIGAFPHEFLEGMETRAGLLGDVRANHPDQWTRPALNWRDGQLQPDGRRIELSSVHIVLQYRIGEPDPVRAAQALHPAIAAEIGALETQHADAVRVLSVQPMQRVSARHDSQLSRGHFGFADGLSQPQAVDRPAAAPSAHSPPGPARQAPWSDEVARGEVLLGYPGDRGGGSFPPQADELLDNGCFMVIRKLRQRLDVLREVVDRAVPPGMSMPAARDQLLAKMMGRRQDGAPLVAGAPEAGNNFDYADDPQGRQCPFQSHARRANPRNAAGIPRIVRQGMSYGPPHIGDGDLAEDRGVVFIAYAASIAEQFEVLQRWIAGGNSSGVLSGYSDPFLGVPEAGVSRSFRYLDEDGGVVRVDLGTRPIVELQWGAYLFVPSIHALRHLGRFVAPAASARRKPAAVPAPADRSQGRWRSLLEDPDQRIAAWQAVRAQRLPPGRLATGYGTLVADARAVQSILRDDGRQYSVCGYGHRLDATIGLGFLGVDPQPENPRERGHAEAVNRAIEAIDAAAAFTATCDEAAKVLQDFAARRRAKPDGNQEAQIDLLMFSEQVLAKLCTRWFGLPDPDGRYMAAGGRGGDNPSGTTPMCPGSFISVSRYVFSPRPSALVEHDARKQGRLIRRKVKAFLRNRPDDKLTPLVGAIRAAVHANTAVPPADRADVVASTVAGVMLGFAPTVGGNFYRVVTQDWVPNRTLWDLQVRLPQASAGFDAMHDVLAPALIAAMRRQPAPDMVWRQPAAAGVCPRDLVDPPAQPVVVGILGAMLDEKADPMLLFGGARSGPGKTTHACPGHGMGMGVLIGMAYALLSFPCEALRPTPADTVVSLINPVI